MSGRRARSPKYSRIWGVLRGGGAEHDDGPVIQEAEQRVEVGPRDLAWCKASSLSARCQWTSLASRGARPMVSSKIAIS